MKQVQMRSLVVFLKLFEFIFSLDVETRTGTFSVHELSVLSVSPFQKLKVLSEMDCAILCTRAENCLSINVGSSAVRGLVECQLLGMDKEHSPQLFANSILFHHYSRVWGPCDKPICQNGATCIANDLRTGYKCQCQRGFMGMHCGIVKWIKFNKEEITFGAKGDQFGIINITVPGHLITMKLVWKSGYVTNDKSYPKTRGHWWGNHRNGDPNPRLGVIITDTTIYRRRIIPLNKDIIITTNEYYLPGYNSMSPYIIYKNFTTPYPVSSGQIFRVWFSLDRDDAFENYNDGSCNIDIYGLYV